MKSLIINIALLILFSNALIAQDVITVESKTNDISDNLDLEAVASVFGDSENLEDFEKRLNDPEAQISNLDLNKDGYVDYLRVVENSEENTILITIQAIIGKDLYQDVATIDVERDNSGNTRVQVVGDVYMYGVDYIIEPVYVYTPVVCTHFWGVHYRRYHSPYYWSYYPSYYYVWHPLPVYVYRNHVHVHVNTRHTYHYTTARRSITAARIGTAVRRNDYGRSNPNKSFSSRNGSAKNTYELDRQRGISRNATSTRVSGSRSTSTGVSTRSSNTRTVNANSSSSTRSTGRKVESNWSGSTRSNGQSTQVRSNRTTTSRTTTTRQTPSKSSSSRSVLSKSSSSRSSGNKSVQSRSSSSRSSGNKSGVKSKSSSSRPTKARSSSSSSSNRSSTSRSSGSRSNNKSSGSSRSGSSQSRSKRR